MSVLNCNVVKDILPLYADEVVCDDTKTLVEEHLEGCEKCRQELFAMKVEVKLPLQTDTVESMKKVKRKLGFWSGVKGMAIMLALVTLAVWLYHHGFPEKAEAVTVQAGTMCVLDRDRNTGKCWKTGEQDFYVNFVSQNSERIILEEEWEYAVNEAGEKVPIGLALHVRTFPCIFSGDYQGTWAASPVRSNIELLPDRDDFIVRIVFADEELVYSMKEEGLWNPAAEHIEGCAGCLFEKEGELVEKPVDAQ